MIRKRSVVFTVIAVLVAVAILAGSAFTAYRVGYARGVAQSPEFAAAVKEAGKDGTFPYGRFYPRSFGGMPGVPFMPMARTHFSFFPMLGGLVGLFLLGLLFFGLVRLIFRPRWGHPGMWHGYPPPWASQQPWGAPPAGQPAPPSGQNPPAEPPPPAG